VDFRRSSVRGTVRVVLEGVKGTLSLNASRMKIISVKSEGSAAKFEHDEERGVLKVSGLRRNPWVTVGFSKSVSDEVIFGLYKSKYGKDHLLVTDLEPAEARTVFPCVDDPSYKAVFRLTVVTEKGLKVISNTEAASVATTSDGRIRYRFAETPRMSTYLFFVGIGNFEEAEKKARRATVIAASRPGLGSQAGYILEESAAILDAYEDFFGVRFPLKKLHLVGLPEYHTGAMENWGAITSRESFVLLGEDAGVTDRRRAAHLMAHEIAHQWFGDLVTMKWWDDLWLNESFATFMDDLILDKMHPDWDCWQDFLRGALFRSLNDDSLAHTHPVQTKVRSVEEVGAIFDSISYGKGASILRMLADYMGEGSFRRGVTRYLKKHSFSNATGKEFWEALAGASGLPVSRVAKAWITKPGFPVVKVDRTAKGFRLSQSKFRLSGRSEPGIWPIPLRMNSGKKGALVLLQKRSMVVESDKVPLVNPGRKGFYSVLYDQSSYSDLASRFSVLNPHDRAGIVSDLYLFLQAGLVGPKTYFRFVSLSARFPDSLSALTISDHFSNLRAIAWDSPDVSENMTAFMRAQMSRLGTTTKKDEDPIDTEVRRAISVQLARIDRRFAARLAPLFAEYDKVEPELRATVANAHAFIGGAPAFRELSGRLKATTNEIERARLYSSLGAFHDPGVVEEALELTIGGAVPRSDSGYSIVAASLNPAAREALWKWVKRRYGRLYGLYAGSQQFFLYMNGVVPRCGVDFEKDVHSFLSGTRYKQGELTYNRTFELLAAGVRLRKSLLGGNVPAK
jgi:tricorn protease interacting factor F2/3